MPKKRAVRKTRRDVEKDRHRERRYERRKERKERYKVINDLARRVRILRKPHETRVKISLHERINHRVYVRVRGRMRRLLIVRSLKRFYKPDNITTEDRIYSSFRLWKDFLSELFKTVMRYLTIWGFRLLAGDRVKYWSEYLRWLKTMYAVMLGKWRVPIMSVWKNGLVELHFDRKLYDFLLSPEYRDITVEALSYIANELLTGNYEFIISPEEMERLKGILQLIQKYYVLYTKDRPCRRSTYGIKLTPVTLHFFRGRTVRMYVVRYFKVRDIKSARLIIEKGIDVHFNFFKMFKTDDDIVSILTYAGDTSNLTGDEQIAIRRDEHRNVRETLKTIVAIYDADRIRRALAREVGKPEIEDGVGHCSIYIGFPRTRKYDIKKQFVIEREMFRRYRNLALG